MSEEEFSQQTQQETTRSPLQEKYEPRLWQKAEELMNIRIPLVERCQELYDKLTTINNSPQVNLFQRDETDTKYRNTLEQIGIIQEQENLIQEALEKLEQSQIEEEELEKIVPHEQQDTEEISRRKRKRIEEMEKLGVDPREIDYFMHREFNSNPTKLTTGRHQKSIHGNLSTRDAEQEFYYRTTDTHGGKAPPGNKGDSYTTASGKRVRKR
jgi:hypothetical protein